MSSNSCGSCRVTITDAWLRLGLFRSGCFTHASECMLPDVQVMFLVCEAVHVAPLKSMIALADRMSYAQQTLWLCDRHDEEAALTFGKAVANTFSQAKGQSLGILPPERWDAQVWEVKARLTYST